MNSNRREHTHACPRCGHATAVAECRRCHGTIRDLGDGRELPLAGGGAVRAFASGFLGYCRAVVHTAHHRAFVGKLRAPVAANLLVVAALLLVGTLWLHPALLAWLAPDAALKGTLAVLLWLGPVLLEVPTGALLEPLVEATELAIGGPELRVVAGSGWQAMASRLRASARVFAVQLLLLPLAIALSLLPYAGLPLLLLGAAANAAVVWFEAPFARRGHDLGARLRGLWRNAPRALGFGLAVQLATFVPFLNLLVLAPAAAVGAAAQYFRFDKRGGAG